MASNRDAPAPATSDSFLNGVDGQADIVKWLRRRVRPVIPKDLDRD